MTRRSHAHPELFLQRKEPQRRAHVRTHVVRAVNPSSHVPKVMGPRTRKPSLKRMVSLGSQVLDRMLKKPELSQESDMRDQVLAVWDVLEIAWSSTQADRRVALTRLQDHLRSWTSEDAWVADDGALQRYRRQLHLVLDH